MLNGLLNNRYKILAELLSDSSSILYEGLDTQDNSPVFIQSLSEVSLKRPLEILLRYKRELELSLKLTHPNILKLYSYSDLDSGFYLILEHFEGRPLAAVLAQPLDADRAVEIILGLAQGLEEAHKQNLLHQAISPNNILYDTASSSLKLFNFGSHLLKDLSRITEPAEITSTFGYLSPEASGILKRPIDTRSDIYSLGMLFYQLLAGRLPYEAEDMGELIHQHIATQPTPPKKLNPKLPPVLEKIALRLIEKDPQKRYQSLAGLMTDLKEYLRRVKEIGGGDALRAAVDFEIARSDRLSQLSFSTKLIGRDRELELLKTLVNKAAQKQGSFCAIFGEPGIGKNRLVDELRIEVHSLKGIFIGGKCYQYEFKTPYKVLSEAIEAYVDKIKRLSKLEQDSHTIRIKQALGELGAEAAKLAPNITELIGEPPELVELEPEKERIRFLITITNFIISLASPESPLLIFLDDLQWADEGSLEILERLAAKLKDSSILLIVSYRDNEVPAGHPLMALLEKLKQEGLGINEIPLKVLSLFETGQIISQILVEKEENILPLAENLYQRAKGNPFFTLELLHSLIDSGAVYLKGEHYSYDLEKIKDTTLPATIVDAVLKRMKALSEEELLVISYAAVIGKEIQFDLLKQLIQRHSDIILDSIEDGIQNQLLCRDITGNEGIFFMHDRIREAFYQRVSEKERVPLHRQIAIVLEAENKDNPEPVIYELAYHFTQGHIENKALQYLLPAAYKAKNSYANTLAIDLYLNAKEILDKEGKKESGQYVEVLENLGETYRFADEFDESLEALDICKSLIPAEDKIHKAQILSKIGDTLFDKGQLEESAEVIGEALKNLDIKLFSSKKGVALGILREFVRQMLHYWFPKVFVREKYKASERDLLVVRMLARLDHIYFVFDMNKTLYCFLKGLNISEKLGPCPELAFSYAIGGGVWSGFPWFSRTFRDLNKGLKMAQGLGDKIREASAYAYTIYASYLANNPKLGLETASKAISLLKAIGEYWDMSLAYAFRNYNYWITGNLEKSKLDTEEFLGIAKEVNAQQTLGWAYFVRGKTLSLLGEIDATVISNLEEASRLSIASKSGADVLHSLAILAFAYSRTKDYPNALKTIEEFSRLFPTHYTKSVWILDTLPMGAQIYLDAVINSPDLTKEQRKQYLKCARRFCRQANFYSFFFKFFYGWTNQVNGTYLWLSGRKSEALIAWKKAVKFLRGHTEDKYRLAYCLLEEASFLFKDNSKDKRAFENLIEARDLFRQMGCKLDLEKANKFLAGISGVCETVDSRDALTQKRHLESLLSVTTTIGSVFILNDLLSKIMDYALEVTGAERGFLFLYEGKGKSLNLKFSKGLTKEFSGLAFSWDNYKISLAFIQEVERLKEALVTGSDSDVNPKIQEEMKAYSTRQAMGIPLVSKDRPLGFVYLDSRLAGGMFGKDELELMKSFAIQASVSIENAFLVKEIVEKERLTEELRLGREIQKNLLPKELPQVPGLNIQGFMNPAKEIGGDYFDFIKLPKDKGLAIAIGDVSGKGVAAGLIMATAKATLKGLSQQAELTPKQVLLQVNSLLCEYTGGDKFMTMLYLKWTPGQRSLEYSSGGHECILVYRRNDNQVEVIRSGGFVLGVLPELDAFLEDKQLKLMPQDKVILYTDGVTEARNPQEELFSRERLVNLIEKYGNQPAEEFIDNLKQEIFAFIGGRDQYDDTTLVVIEARD